MGDHAEPPRLKKCCGSAFGYPHKIGCVVAMGKERYRADDSRGRRNPNPSPTIIVCISLTKAELAELDAAAHRAQMSRSHFLREAYKHLIAASEPTT